MTTEKKVAESHDIREMEWLQRHSAAVAAVQPAWADSSHTEVDFDYNDDAEGLLFSRRVGCVAIEQLFVVKGGNIYPAGEPKVWEEVDGHPLEIERVTAVGTDLIRAAQVLNGPGEVSASMFEIVGTALGLNGLDLYALAHVETEPENDITMGDLFRVYRYTGIHPADLAQAAKSNGTVLVRGAE